MIKTYKYIALFALAFGFAACSQEDDFIPQGNQKGDPLAIASAGVVNLTTRATISTIEGTNCLTGGSMGVFVKSENTNTRYKGDNLKWEYDSSWKPSSTTVLYEADGTKQQIGAYYPYTAELTEGTCIIELPETFDDKYEDYDYLYSDYVAVSTNPMNIQMNHLLSKVTVSIASKGSEIDITDAVKSVSLSDVSRTAVWTVPTATLNGYGPADQVTTLYANDADNDQTVDNYVGYALPNAAATLGIRVTMNSGRSFAAQASISDGLAGGNHYLISMKLGKDGITVGNITIADWDIPENNVSGSEVTEIFIRSTVSGTTAAIDIVSSAKDGVKAAIEALFMENPMLTTLTVNGTLNEVQQATLAEVLTVHSGVKLIMDMNENEVSEAVTNLTNEKQLGGYAIADDGTYTVYTVAGLQKWSEAVSESEKTNLTLGADILLPTHNISVDENGRPSGSNWKTVPSFNGTIDGCGHSIVNLRTYGSDASFIDFGETSAVIKNLTFLTPVVYQSSTYLGVIAGRFDGTLIENCHVVGGSVTGDNTDVGGLVGGFRSKYVKIFASTNSAKVKGERWVGGIAGYGNVGGSFGPAIVACVNTGVVSGNRQVAGIFGCAGGLDRVVACYTTENIISGYDGNITGCYYVAAEDTDGENGTTAVADKTALNSEDVVNAMNAAIDDYNDDETVKVTYKWKVGTILPELELVSE